MTNYNNDTLELIPGETPKQKYEWVKKMAALKGNLIERSNMLEKHIEAYEEDKRYYDALINQTKKDQFDLIINKL